MLLSARPGVDIADVIAGPIPSTHSSDLRHGMWTCVRSASVDSYTLLGASWRSMVENLDDSE
jgi:hypothetical protein